MEWPAPPALRPAVTCLWAKVVPECSATISSVVLPDAASDLIWEQGKGSFVAGPDTGPAPAQMTPGAILFGVRLKPWAGGPVLGLPLSELRDRRVPLADLGHRDVPGTLDPYPAVERMLDLAGRLVTGSTPDPDVTHAASLLRDPRVQVEDVVRETGISVRQLRRRFHAAVGYGPKTLQRVLRFHRFVTQIDTSDGTIDLAGLAADLGYADQAHLTRECVMLAGVTPRTLRTIRGTG